MLEPICSSIRVVHGKGKLSGNFFFFLCHVSQFNWLPVVSISFFEVRTTCHFLTGLRRFICPGQLPIYSGIPPLPSTFAKFSPLTSRALSRSLCIHRLLSSRSKYFLFFSSLGFQFSKKCMKFLFLRSVIVQKRL